jgi:hypothetical protein
MNKALKALITSCGHEQIMQLTSLIFVVISLLVIVLIYGSISASNIYALPPYDGYLFSQTCGAPSTDPRDGKTKQTCCWTEMGGSGPFRPRVNVCQTCTVSGESPTKVGDCKEKVQQGLVEQPPIPLPSSPAAPLQGGVLDQPPSQGLAPLLPRGQSVLPGEGVLQETPAGQDAAELPPPPTSPPTEETQPVIIEEEQPEPACQEGLEFNEDLGFCVLEDCPEGQVLNEESGICELEEPSDTEEVGQPEQEEVGQSEQGEVEQQPGEGDGSSEENSD